MDELEREIKIYGEVDRVITDLKPLRGKGDEADPVIKRTIDVLWIMRDELRRSDLEIKDLKAGMK